MKTTVGENKTVQIDSMSPVRSVPSVSLASSQNRYLVDMRRGADVAFVMIAAVIKWTVYRCAKWQFHVYHHY